jgi:hypothetical protein
MSRKIDFQALLKDLDRYLERKRISAPESPIVDEFVSPLAHSDVSDDYIRLVAAAMYCRRLFETEDFRHIPPKTLAFLRRKFSDLHFGGHQFALTLYRRKASWCFERNKARLRREFSLSSFLGGKQTGLVCKEYKFEKFHLLLHLVKQNGFALPAVQIRVEPLYSRPLFEYGVDLKCRSPDLSCKGKSVLEIHDFNTDKERPGIFEISFENMPYLPVENDEYSIFGVRLWIAVLNSDIITKDDGMFEFQVSYSVDLSLKS